MKTSSSNKQLPKPKRRWFRFRLRTLLVIITLVSGALGWVGWDLDQRRSEQVTIAWFKKMGGRVAFETRITSGPKKAGGKKRQIIG